MIGTIAGDIIGSPWEFNNIKTKDFKLFSDDCYFTDDTVMTCAIAESLMRARCDYSDLAEVTVATMRDIGQLYPYCGYGGKFMQWMFTEDPKPYDSLGNGAAMRVSPVAYVAKNLKEVEKLSDIVTGVTHNHREGLRGARVTAVATYLALQGASKMKIWSYLSDNYPEFLPDLSVNGYRKHINGHGEETCIVSVPEALQCFFASKSYEDTIRNCVSIGGDTDTTAAIAGSIAEAFYGVPLHIARKASTYLDRRLLAIMESFEEYTGRTNILKNVIAKIKAK